QVPSKGCPSSPSNALLKGVAITRDFESYHIPEIIKENESKKLLSKDLKEDDDKPDLEVILASLIDNYLEVLQEWIPKLIGLKEEKKSSANTNYSNRINNLGCCNKNRIRNNKCKTKAFKRNKSELKMDTYSMPTTCQEPTEVENVETYNHDCYHYEIFLKE
ncbi:40462_t:CDS:1, partial [Gigaspora margarita]